MVLGEVADAAALQVEHAQHAVLQDQRHRHLGTDAGVGRNVARVGRGIVHPDHIARFRGRAGDPFAQRDVVDVHTLVVAQAEEMAQGAGFLVDVENTEGVIADQLAHGAGNLAEQLVQVQDGGELARDVGQGAERAVLAVHAAIKPGVVDGDGDAPGDQAQQGAVVFGVGIQPHRLQVDHAHQLAARGHRDRQFGADGIHQAQVARVSRHVAHQHRLTQRGRGSGNALAHPDAEVVHHVLRGAPRRSGCADPGAFR